MVVDLEVKANAEEDWVDLVKLEAVVVGIARLLAQEVVVGFLVQNKSLMLLLDKSLTL
jgi:hypothetical protein